MKEVTTYIAWDDKEFTNRSKCEAYEEHTRTIIRQLEKSITMYDKNNNKITWKDETNIESWSNWFEDIFDSIENIELHCILHKNIKKYLRNFYGYDDITQLKPGKYHYNWNTCEWVK